MNKKLTDVVMILLIAPLKEERTYIQAGKSACSYQLDFVHSRISAPPFCVCGVLVLMMLERGY